jgi:hypothetical protein
MPQRKLEQMELILQRMIELNTNIRTNRYRKMSLHRVPKRNIKVPYDFYLN